MSRLEKNLEVTIIPGDPGVPTVQGTTGTPGYWTSSTTYTPSTSTSGSNPPSNSLYVVDASAYFEAIASGSTDFLGLIAGGYY